MTAAAVRSRGYCRSQVNEFPLSSMPRMLPLSSSVTVAVCVSLDEATAKRVGPIPPCPLPFPPGHDHFIVTDMAPPSVTLPARAPARYPASPEPLMPPLAPIVIAQDPVGKGW